MRAEEDLWTGRIDSHENPDSFRLHQVVEQMSVDQLQDSDPYFAFIGFESDEGVRRNKGRQGLRKRRMQFVNILLKSRIISIHSLSM